MKIKFNWSILKKMSLMIYGWIIFSIAAQTLVYTLADKFYFNNRELKIEDLKIKLIDVADDKKMEKNTNIFVEIPTNAQNIKISYNGDYFAYILDKKINVVDVLNGKTIKVIENFFNTIDPNAKKVEGQITAYSWIPGKNMFIYAISTASDVPAKAQVYSYDITTEVLHTSKNSFQEQITNSSLQSYIPRGAEITDILISPLTMVYYARIKQNATSDRLYRVDINDDLYPSVTIPSSTNVKIAYFSEDISYNEKNIQLNVKSGTKYPVILNMPSKYVLIGMGGALTEAKDNIYVGILNDDDKIEKIIYGNAATKISDWKNINLEKPVIISSVFLKDNASLFCLNSENSVIDLNSKKKYKFEGIFVDVTSSYLISKVDNKLKFINLSK